MSEKLMSFSEALNKANGKKRFLIGNGFSNACRKKNVFLIVHYLKKQIFQNFQLLPKPLLSP